MRISWLILARKAALGLVGLFRLVLGAGQFGFRGDSFEDLAQAFGHGLEESPFLFEERSFELRRMDVTIADLDDAGRLSMDLDRRGLFPMGSLEIARFKDLALEHDPRAGGSRETARPAEAGGRRP